MPFVQVLTNSSFKYITAYLILNLNAKWGCSVSTDDYNVGSLAYLDQSCFGLRRMNIEIFAPIGDFENLSPRLDLEIFSSFED
ncbi:hypothetical protein HZH66_012688 [Vespula vulgaris]|uniref:Uncharacterized protein n=1 Tax=Vespula vulgaris TaxID=7454 RepID=A0A834MVG1_VESVU|nr:hypothetical protein HZH66_012688 [Vespula vulgaris]